MAYGGGDAMADIAKQLNTQMEYVNELLGQIQRLEGQHLAFQKSATEKQGQLRQALHVADAARADANDAKRKLAVAQDVAARMTEDAKQAKVDVGVLKRQVDSLERYAVDAKADVAALREARAAAEAQVAHLAADNKALATAASESNAEADETIQHLTATNAGLTRDLQDVRKQLGPLHAEVDAGKTQVSRLKEEAEAAKKARIETQARLEKVNTILGNTEVALRESQSSERRLADALSEERARGAELEAQLQATAEVLSKKEEELATSGARLDDALDALRSAQEETIGVQREAEAIANELMSVARARASEKTEFEARLGEALDDLRRIADEARTREAQHAADAARRAEEVIAARREGEASVETIQDENAALQDMLSHIRVEASQAARAWDEQRNGYERKITETAQRAALATEGQDRELAELRARLQEAGATIDDLHAEAEVREAAHVEVLSGMQAALRKLASEFAAVQAEQATVGRTVRALVAHMEAGLGEKAGQQPLDAWFEEAKKTFLVLAERVQGERRRADIERDNTRASELSCEELRSRVLMLEEALSKAEHEAHTRGALLQEAQATLASHHGAAATELRAAASMTADLQAELTRVKEKLDKSNKARIALQGEAARAASELADGQSKASARVSSLESTVGSLEGSVRTLSATVEGLQDEKVRLNAALEATSAGLAAATREKQAVIAEAERAAEVAKHALAQYAAQVSALSDGLRAMEKQTKQTQSLLGLSQEQRRGLEDANAQLRAELDGIYAASLAGAASAYGGGGGGGNGNNNDMFDGFASSNSNDINNNSGYYDGGTSGVAVEQ